MAHHMIVSFAWPSSWHRTGGVVVMYHFANGLARRGHEVHFLHGPAWPHRIDHIDELDWFTFDPGVHHHVVDAIDDPRLPSGDVIFAISGRPEQGLPGLFMQGAHMLPEPTERSAFRLRGAKVCVARWLVDIGRRYGVPDEQLWHVPLGLDHELFRVHEPTRERPYDVAVTYHTHPTKGWPLGFEALVSLQARRPDLRVAVFGAAQPAEQLAPWIDFWDYPRHEVLAEEVYNASRLFLQPSYQEGFGLTCIEAMACGAALVTTDNGGSADYAVHGETALVVPPGDKGALAGAMETLLDDEAQRTKLAEAGERLVRRFDWEHSVDLLEEHLRAYIADPDAYRHPPSPEGADVMLW